MTTMPQATPARGIESIAHHFLSQVSSSKPSVKRLSPNQQSPSQSVQEAVSPVNSDDVTGQPVSKPTRVDTCDGIENTRTDNDDAIMPVRIALISVGSHTNEALADQYARQIAYHNGRVGLLSIRTDSLKMVEYDSSIPDEQEEKTYRQNPFSKQDLSLHDDELRVLLESVTPGSGNTDVSDSQSADNNMEESFRHLANNAEALLIHSDPQHGACYESIIKSSDVAMLLTHTDSDSLVRTYQNIKWLANDLYFKGTISLYITDSDACKVDAVYEKLANTAQQFLKIELGEPEFPLPVENTHKKVLYEQAVDQRQLDNLQCLLSCREIAINDSDKQGTKVKEDETIKISTSLARKKTVYCPLAVSEFPVDAAELTETLASSASAWLTEVEGPVIVSIPLPKSVDSAVKLLADFHGRCYILLADYQPDQLLTRVCAVRHWLTDHLPLIRQACPNIKMDLTLEPGMVLIAAGDVDCLRRTMGQFDSLPFFAKQLILMDDGANRQLLVV